MNKIGSIALVFNKGSILALKCVKGRGLILPGGKKEDGESPRDAAIRELKEETNLDALRSRLVYESFDNTGYYCYAYSCQVADFDKLMDCGSGEPCWVQPYELHSMQQTVFTEYYLRLFYRPITLRVEELGLGF